MHLFYGRPLALAVCAAVAVAVPVSLLSSIPKLFLLCVCLYFLLCLLIYAWVRKQCGKILSTVILCLIAVCLLLFSSWLFFNKSVDTFAEKTANGATVEGYVLERKDEGAWKSVVVADLTEINGERRSARVWIKFDHSTSLQAGECFRLFGTPEIPQDTSLYPETGMLLQDGCVGILRCSQGSDCSVLDGKRDSLRLRFRTWNASLTQRLRFAVGGEEGALASALLLGNRSGLSEHTELAFRRSGVSHLLALSGMHVSVLILLLERILSFFHIPKRQRAAGILLCALLYLGITGCSVSTVRAVLMVSMMYIGFFLREDYDPFTGLCAVLFLLLLCTPYAVLDVSLWLSFSAAAGIVVFLPAVTDFLNRLGSLRFLPRLCKGLICAGVTALAVGSFANAAVLFFLLRFFGSASLFSLPVTLLLSPILTLGLLLCFAALLLPTCPVLGFLTSKTMQLMLHVADRVSEIPNGTVRLDGSLTVLLLIFSVGLLCLFAVIKLKRRRLLALPLLLSAAVMFSGFCDVLPPENGIAFSFFSEEGNDTMVFTEGRRTVAWDLSGGTSDTETEVASAALTDRYTELDELAFSHYHSRMSALIVSLSGRIKLRAVRLPIPKTQDERAIAARLAEEAALCGASLHYGKEDMPLEAFDVVLWEAVDCNSADPPVILAFRIKGRILTYLAGGCVTEGSRSLVQNAVNSAQTVVFGAGETANAFLNGQISFPNHTERVIFADQDTQAACISLALPPATELRVGSCRFFL